MEGCEKGCCIMVLGNAALMVFFALCMGICAFLLVIRCSMREGGVGAVLEVRR